MLYETQISQQKAQLAHFDSIQYALWDAYIVVYNI